MTDYNLLIGTMGTAFFIQVILNRIAAVCGIVLALLHYRETKRELKNKVILAVMAGGVIFLLLCWNFLCIFFDGTEEYHSFTSPDGTHTIVIMENVSGISGQVVLYEQVKEVLIKSTRPDWRTNFHAPRGKKSQEYFLYFKIF